MTLVTKQTGPAGKEVKRLYVEEGCDIKRELYLSLLVDRASAASPSSPRPKAAWRSRRWPREHPGEDRQASRSIRPPALRPFHARKIAFALGLEGKQVGIGGQVR